MVTTTGPRPEDDNYDDFFDGLNTLNGMFSPTITSHSVAQGLAGVIKGQSLLKLGADIANMPVYVLCAGKSPEEIRAILKKYGYLK